MLLASSHDSGGVLLERKRSGLDLELILNRAFFFWGREVSLFMLAAWWFGAHLKL